MVQWTQAGTNSTNFWFFTLLSSPARSLQNSLPANSLISGVRIYHQCSQTYRARHQGIQRFQQYWAILGHEGPLYRVFLLTHQKLRNPKAVQKSTLWMILRVCLFILFITVDSWAKSKGWKHLSLPRALLT